MNHLLFITEDEFSLPITTFPPPPFSDPLLRHKLNPSLHASQSDFLLESRILGKAITFGHWCITQAFRAPQNRRGRWDVNPNKCHTSIITQRRRQKSSSRGMSPTPGTAVGSLGMEWGWAGDAHQDWEEWRRFLSANPSKHQHLGLLWDTTNPVCWVPLAHRSPRQAPFEHPRAGISLTLNYKSIK